jgi:ribosomal protein S18 acetylase RimI-like enzyme
VRAYRPGDEVSIVELSNRSLAPYAGWVARTVDYWRWSMLARPGVDPTDILLLESGGKIVGYAALHRDGSVLDFFVDPDQPARKRRAFVRQLVSELEDHARARECDMLTFWEPASDRVIDKVLRKAGYVVERSQYLSLGILNPLSLLQQLLLARQSRLASLRSGPLILELTPGQYPFLLNSRLLIQLDPIPRVEDISTTGEYPDHCIVRMDLCALTELIFCRVRADSLLEQGRLAIEPQAKVGAACELLDALAIEAPWHVPKSDGF